MEQHHHDEEKGQVNQGYAVEPHSGHAAQPYPAQPPQYVAQPPQYGGQQAQYAAQPGPYYGQYPGGQPIPVVTTAPAVYTVAPHIIQGQQVPDHMGLAIFACLCCCWPIAVVAIMRASEARSALAVGNVPQAQASSASSKQMSHISIGVGIAIYIIIIIAVGVQCGVNACGTSYGYTSYYG